LTIKKFKKIFETATVYLKRKFLLFELIKNDPAGKNLAKIGSSEKNFNQILFSFLPKKCFKIP